MASSTPVFALAIDWLNDGDFTAPGDDVSRRLLTRSPVTVSYGRDQSRALSPVKPGAAAFELNNVSRDYSPENTGSPLHGNLVPGRPVLLTAAQDATIYTFYRGFLDDYTVQPNPTDRSVQFSCLDVLARFQGVTLSTPLLGPGVRTGTAVGALLDQLGWPAALRDIDLGATTIPWWWEEGTDGLTALTRILAAEGPPAIVYMGSSGAFTFRDRHHRLIRPASLTEQATFTSGTSAADGPSVATYSPPVSYDAGWRDIVNTVNVSIGQRAAEGTLSVVWQSTSVIAVPSGGSVAVIAQASDPFTAAITPVAGTDFLLQSGAVTVSLSRTSGQSATITVTDTGGGSVISGLQLRAYAVSVVNTVQVSGQDAPSVAAYGVRNPPSTDLSAACPEDAAALAVIYFARYAQRRPIIAIPVMNANGFRLTQQLSRNLSDLVHVTDTQTGLDAACYIEQISHTTTDAGMALTTVFGCEKAPVAAGNVFTFDKTGAGFDQGTFGVSGLDNPASVWIWNTQSTFDTNLLAT